MILSVIYSYYSCSWIYLRNLVLLSHEKCMENWISTENWMVAYCHLFPYTHSITEEKHGKAAIEIYPIISARLLIKCEAKGKRNQWKLSYLRHWESIELCLKTFDFCSLDPDNREEKPEYFNAARRIVSELKCRRYRDCPYFRKSIVIED